MYDLRVIHGQCYIDHEFIDTNIYVQNGKIVLIDKKLLDAKETIDAKGCKVIPGMIDPHVHLKLNIGHTCSADDFVSGGKLAASGGITCLIDFLDPIYTNDEFEHVFNRRLSEARGCMVDYSFHTTLANYNDDISWLVTKVKDTGLSSIKAFTTYSDSNRKLSDAMLATLLDLDILTLVHAEADELVLPCNDMKSYEASRSETSERKAVEWLLAHKGKGSLYIVHVSSGSNLKTFEKSERVYFESCPQYFYLTKNKFEGENGKLYLLAPPIRSQEAVEDMIRSIEKLDTIGTDHCPFMSYEKLVDKEVDKIPKGLGTLGYGFQLMYDLFGPKIIDHFTENPARIFGLSEKGKLKVGYDADIVLFKENGLTRCDAKYSLADYSVYQEVLKTQVIATICRGQLIYHSGQFYTHEGLFIRRRYEGNY